MAVYRDGFIPVQRYSSSGSMASVDSVSIHKVRKPVQPYSSSMASPVSSGFTRVRTGISKKPHLPSCPDSGGFSRVHTVPKPVHCHSSSGSMDSGGFKQVCRVPQKILLSSGSVTSPCQDGDGVHAFHKQGLCHQRHSSSCSSTSVEDLPRSLDGGTAEGEKVLDRVKSDLAARNVDFVKAMPEEIQTECSICLSILLEPHIVECCGNRFCKTCIGSVVQARQPCPLCKQRNFQKIPDKQLQRLLNQREVYCLLKKEGCKWTGEMDKLQKHLDLTKVSLQWEGILNLRQSQDAVCCGYVPTKCPHCRLKFLRHSLKDHKVVCPMREIKCVYCDEYSCPAQDLLGHYKSCPSFLVPCPHGCALKTHKCKDLTHHLEKECPLHEVQCDYHFAGCEVLMLRSKMSDHMEANVKEHLLLVSTKYKDLEVEYKNLKKNTTESETTKFLYISNLPPTASESHLHSRFGQFGLVSKIDMIPSRSAAIIEFASDEGYTRTLSYAHKYPINLLKHSMKVTPM